MLFDPIKKFFLLFLIQKRPTKRQWKQIFKLLTKKEKILFLLFLILFIGSSFFLVLNFYLKNTELQPASGGIYIEGVIGQPRFINPVYARTSDIDQDLVELIFSGLMKYDEQGRIVPDLAQNYEIKENGTVYEVFLKEGIFWSDNSPLTADDVVFTIKTIQNSDYKSPVRASWLGVDIEKISDLGIRFKLKNSYAPFLENLTQKIIPKKVWENVLAQNFHLSLYNLKPIGSGPYRLKDLKQDKSGKIVSLDLVKNPRYYGKTPFLSQISFRFFNPGEEEDMVKSYRAGKILGFSLNASSALNNLTDESDIYFLSLPRYFALFFNPGKAKILSDLNVRQALNYGINKEGIIEKVFLGYGEIVHSPLLPELYDILPPCQVYQFDPVAAKELLEKAGYLEQESGIRVKTTKKEPSFQFKSDLKEGSKGAEVENLQRCLANPPAGGPEIYPEGEVTGSFGSLTKQAVIKFQEKYRKDILEPSGIKEATGQVFKATRTKLNELCFPSLEESLPLKFSLTTVNQPLLIAVAEILKNQWKDLGVEVEIKTFDISELEKEAIKTRGYETLLFGEALGAIPDPFPFWHSSQKKDPGLNLAFYENKKVDKALEEARGSSDQNLRKEKFEELQEIIIQDAPAVFLYNPDYIYIVKKEVKGIDLGMIIDPSKRFSGIENWYITTKRKWR